MSITHRLDVGVTKAYAPGGNKGDVLTGDGIERVLEEQSHPAPDGGEGGSVLQALGSKAEERAKRRKKKKDSYALYLESETWKKLRARVLKRDKHICRACSGRAQVVHHIRYPKNLGEERLEWLYSLCAPCHNEIHRLAGEKGVTLKKATRQVLNLPPPQKTKKAKPLPKRIVERRLRRQEKRGGLSKRVFAAKRSKKRELLADENERLHELQRANREKRERSWVA